MDNENSSCVATTCPYCGVGCGVLVQTDNDGHVRVQGDPNHPANFGRLCSKGAALGETLDLDGRLLYPRIQGKRVTWETALEAVASGFRRVIDNYGPQAVAFYVSGQLFTEDYYVANKLMKGFIGSGNIDTNSRLCMASAVAGHKRAFGTDTVPCNYTDLEQADLLILVGSNTAWCHPVLFQRIQSARASRQKPSVVVIDPRHTATCEIADLHLPLAPGTDAILFNGLLNYCRREDALDWDFLEQHTQGFAAAMQAAKACGDNIPEVAAACGLKPDDVGRFFRLFAKTSKTVTLFSQGVNQSSSGTDKVNSIINCHLATGRIGKPSCGPFSITGQPNAMGGREVGGLANTLAAHMEFEDEAIDRVARFWGVKRVAQRPGLKAVELFNAIGKGEIKAVWIMATNPMVSLPAAKTMQTALARCEFIVVSDCVQHTDTTAFADILLPASTWGEKDGTVTNSERRISRQRAFLPSPKEAKPDWWIISQVAQRMGHSKAFSYRSAADVFREHARLSGFENNGSRAFDISALGHISDQEYDALKPFQWPFSSAQQSVPLSPFNEGRFYTNSGKARLIPVMPNLPAHLPDDEFPLVLNTGRIRDQWHTMTRTGKSPRLCAHMPEPLLLLNPQDGSHFHLADGQLAQVVSRWGKAIARVKITTTQPPGSAFFPIHWSHQNTSHAKVGTVVNPVTDPLSGEPEFKHTPIRLVPYEPCWYGFILTRKRIDMDVPDFWSMTRGEQYWRYEIAGNRMIDSWSDWMRTHWSPEGEWIEYTDAGSGRYRGAKINNNQLEGCVFVSPSFELPSRSWLIDLFDKKVLTESQRRHLLAASPPTGQVDNGDIICSCFGVGRNVIVNGICEAGLDTPEAIGSALRAGTNCGSCIPELRNLIKQYVTNAAA